MTASENKQLCNYQSIKPKGAMDQAIRNVIMQSIYNIGKQYYQNHFTIICSQAKCKLNEMARKKLSQYLLSQNPMQKKLSQEMARKKLMTIFTFPKPNRLIKVSSERDRMVLEKFECVVLLSQGQKVVQVSAFQVSVDKMKLIVLFGKNTRTKHHY